MLQKKKTRAETAKNKQKKNIITKIKKTKKQI